MDARQEIQSTCEEVLSLLLEKNKAYGNAALEPLDIFPDLTPVMGLQVRIQDKLKRIKNRGLNDETEDTLLDLCGYFILLLIASRQESNVQRDI